MIPKLKDVGFKNFINSVKIPPSMNRNLWIIAIIVIMLSSCIVVESPCPATQGDQVTVVADDRYELLEDDALTLIDQRKITGDQVTVDGVGLGDGFQDLLDAIGTPQVIDEFYDDNIINAKYENEDGETTYIFHLENDSITRIVIRGGLNPRLPEGSKINIDLADITTRFGKPEFNEDVLLANSGYRTYYYYTRGLEIYHARKNMIGYAFVMPQEVPDDLDFNRYED